MGALDPAEEPANSALATLGARGRADGGGAGYSAARHSERGRVLGHGC
jgi:hypothetical protein